MTPLRWVLALLFIAALIVLGNPWLLTSDLGIGK